MSLLELRVFISIFITALMFLSVGFFARYKPSSFGGSFKITRTPKLSIKLDATSNSFIIRNIKLIGTAILIAGFAALIFAFVYLFYPEILLNFNYAK